jgi:hypothetical protein
MNTDIFNREICEPRERRTERLNRGRSSRIRGKGMLLQKERKGTKFYHGWGRMYTDGNRYEQKGRIMAGQNHEAEREGALTADDAE